MTAYPLLGLTLLAGYLLGGVPFGWLVARWRGVDILRQGSGNIGATNVGRVLGRRFGALVFLLDFAKGALPVLAASFLTPLAAADLPPDSLPAAAGVAAFLGHLFPIYLRFHGGKGVATGVGVIAVLLPVQAVVVLAVWVVVLFATRYVSLASLTAGVLLCGLRLAITPNPWHPENVVVTAFCLFATALVFLRHAGNIRRLFQGSENRLKDSPTMLLFSKTVHVLALGLWFGAAIFFTIVGAMLFPTFIGYSLENPRPIWFPVAKEFDKPAPGEKFPTPLLREQGSRTAGAAIGPLFPVYYGIQGGCAVLTTATALGWSFARKGQRVHVIRAAALSAALACVGAGWWLERVVDGLRVERNRLTDAVLTMDVAPPDEVAKASAARAAFDEWHSYSLDVNFVGVALAAVAMTLAAQLPTDVPRGADPHATAP